MAIGLVVSAGAVVLTRAPGLSDWLLASCPLVIAVETPYSLVDARAVRRARLAGRWLADPLPRGDEAP
jgi:hypothetical protein